MTVKIFMVQKKVNGEFVNIYPALTASVAFLKKIELERFSNTNNSDPEYRIVKYDAKESEIHQRGP